MSHVPDEARQADVWYPGLVITQMEHLLLNGLRLACEGCER